MPLRPDVIELVESQSGEGRFRWLHARPGRPTTCSPRPPARARRPGVGATQGQVLDEGWFGTGCTEAAAGRLGDVVARRRGDVAFDDPADTGPFALIARHGSVTAAEMLVPLVGSLK